MIRSTICNPRYIAFQEGSTFNMIYNGISASHQTDAGRSRYHIRMIRDAAIQGLIGTTPFDQLYTSWKILVHVLVNQVLPICSMPRGKDSENIHISPLSSCCIA